MSSAILVLLTAPLGAQAVDRAETSLNGTWEYVRVPDLEAPPPAEGWRSIEVPGQIQGINYERAWFRRALNCDLPAGRRAKLRFGGIKWNSRVLVNDRPVGGCFAGFEAFDLDITEALRPGANELLVGACDWTGIFLDRSTDLSDLKGAWSREVPRDQGLAPIGGVTEMFGIWDDVTLITQAPVVVSDLFIKTSVQEKRLTVDVTVTNETAQPVETTLAAEVERSEPEDELPRLPPQPLSLPAGGSRTVTLEAAWSNPHLWSHLDPHLYFLKTSLATGDVLRTRFGFREFRVQGPSFYLNGRKLNLLATSWWPTPNPMTPDAIREQFRMMQHARCVAFRTHTQPWCERWYEIADEVGILMIPEGPVWNDDAFYRLDDERFWDNYARALERMVTRDRNKPSVVMWSLENEFFGGRLANDTPYEAKLADLGRRVKQADPTRPIFYESDGDPGGVADVIGIHYPHEYPDFVQWPNEADWLARPSSYTWGFLDDPSFVWKRDKPLYIGEFLWIPSSDPSWETVWFGDESYRDYRRYHVLGKAEAWRQQIIGYRRHEVAGISPWTMVEGGALDEDNPLVQAHRYAYQPIAAFPREYDSRFFAGETVERTLDVFNDAFADATLTVEWRARLGDMGLPGGERTLAMPSGAHEVVTAQLAFPPVQAQTEGEYTVRVLRDGQAVFEDTHPISVFPRAEPLSVQGTVGLYDPEGTTGKLLSGARPVADLANLPEGLQVLVVGGGALRDDRPPRPVIGGAGGTAALSAWVSRGGCAVVLEQTAWPQGLIPAVLDRHASTMAFPQAPAHPLLRDVRAEDLKYWRGDHTVTAAEPVRPTGGTGLSVVVSGSALGINHAPLLVLPHGAGVYVLCQLKVVSRFDAEPTAGILLRNLLAYAATYQGSAGRTALYCDLPAVKAKLDELRLQADDVTGQLPGTDLTPYDLLIYASPAAAGLAEQMGRLTPWVEAGGNVLVHGLAADEYATLADDLDPDLELTPYAGHALRAPAEGVTQASLLECFANEDLYWLGEHVGISWSETPLAQTTAAAVFQRRLDPAAATRYPASSFRLTGQIVDRLQGDEGVIFATIGAGKVPIELPEAGDYALGVVARGTPTDGVYPIAELRIDGRRFGSVSIRNNEWTTYTATGQIEGGKHALEVAFINDGSRPPAEDRNLYVQALLVSPVKDAGRALFLTQPAALVQFPRGKGSFVVDNIAWDTEDRNAGKANRFISGLLTGLGARFASEPGAAIEAEDMEPQPGMQHFSKGGGRVVIATMGYIETEVEVAQAGAYTVELVAGGSPAAGRYPIVDLALNGQSLGKVELRSGGMRPYRLPAQLSAGVQKLRVTFTNDSNVGGEDRNLYVDRVAFYPID